MEQTLRKGGEIVATELAKAYVQIIPSAKGIGKQIGDEIGGESDSAGKSAGSRICNAIKGAIATAAIGKALGAALTEGAALEQSIGGIETLFKDSADKVKQNAAEAYRTAGMSANQYMELTTSFAASLMQSLGNDTEKAAEISDMAMTDMSDNANKMGTDMERITDAYQGFAKQNYTMLDNLKLGYGGTKTEMERLLADAQKITGIKYDINNLSDVYSAIHVIQGELGITGTTAKEAASTLSGSFSSMKAAFQNVLGEITLGMDVGPSLNALATTVTTFLAGNLLPAIWNILSSLPGALATFVQALGPQLLTAISGLFGQISSGLGSGGQILSMVSGMITQIGNAIVTNAPLIFQAANNLIAQLKLGIQTQLPQILQSGSQLLMNFVNGILRNLPYLIAGAGQVTSNLISTISGAVPILIQKGGELLMNLVNGILNNLPQIISAGTQAVSSMASAITSNLPQILQSGVQLLLNLVNGIINNLPQIVSAGAKAVSKLVASIASNLPQILQSGITLIGQLAAGLIKAIPNLVSKIPQIITSIKNAFLDTDWLSIGKNIISGIANGLANAGSALWDAVKGVLGSFKDKVLSFFGINSPSRWGMYVGEMIDIGLANGISDNENAIARAVRNVQDAVSGPFASDVAYSIRQTGTTTTRESNDTVAMKIDELISLLRAKSGKKEEIVINLKDREVARAFKEMGVVFV